MKLLFFLFYTNHIHKMKSYKIYKKVIINNFQKKINMKTMKIININIMYFANSFHYIQYKYQLLCQYYDIEDRLILCFESEHLKIRFD